MIEKEIFKVIERVLKLPKECEWVEFKSNHLSEEDIGKYISALSNGSSLHNEPSGYLIFGINDNTHLVKGTTFNPILSKVRGEELENWLLQRLSPRIDFQILQVSYQDKNLSIFKIQAANGQPTCFLHKDYIRVGTYTRSLKEFPEKERKIWINKPKEVFEKGIAIEVEDVSDVIKLLDTQSYFELLKIPYPSNRDAVIERFVKEKFIKIHSNRFEITNLGAILFAKDLNNFENLEFKAPRVILYEGNNKLKTLKDQDGILGYALGFDRLIKYINALLPSNEVIGIAFRETKLMYPELAIRELVANALVHQDFSEKGSAPLIEIFSDRIEISNPGIPLISADRFIDEYLSRNELLSSVMRRLGICEKKGSGMDKVVFNIELYQLPAYDVQIQEKHTKVILYSYQKFAEMDKKDRVRSCYQHACLKYITNQKMTNTSLRERFQIADENAAMVSRIIKDTYEAGFIKEEDPESKSRKFVKYIPIWA
ncbi:MAG: putative DNA binding domain-containing protein [Chryseobacterium sp.]|nr:putative DNA binding domain-containing protein [Chryseobacterium sp.]